MQHKENGIALALTGIALLYVPILLVWAMTAFPREDSKTRAHEDKHHNPHTVVNHVIHQ